MIVEANINEVDYLIDEGLEMNMFVIFKVNLIIQSWAVMGWYWCYKTCMRWEEEVFFLQRNGWRKPIMENSSTSKVLGVKKIKLNMTSGKLLTLNNVQYVANIRKNHYKIS
jgi:hypothetical protein